MESGEVLVFVRANGRVPADDFLEGLEKKDRKKFEGSFDALVRTGSSYQNEERFRPLKGDGKPLWEFKEFKHRLYCRHEALGGFLRITLFSGHTKTKNGDKRETEDIARAKRLLEELLKE